MGRTYPDIRQQNYLEGKLCVQTCIVLMFSCVVLYKQHAPPYGTFLCTLFLQASSMEVKQEWIRNIREVIQERTVHLKGALKEPIHLPKTPSRQRSISKRSLMQAPFSHYLIKFCPFLSFSTLTSLYRFNLIVEQSIVK